MRTQTSGLKFNIFNNKAAVVVITVILAGIAACSDQGDLRKQAAVDNICATKDNKQTAGCVDGRLLHVPSPDWRDQIIYFLMLDRFDDGDPANNDQGAGVYDPTKGNHYSGGDIRGVINNLDYIKSLGATAVWTTPQVANLWWDPTASNIGYSGYHGYWARDFKAVDEHYGTLDDYKDLSHALHTRGMYLIQDIVVNHVGNYFAYGGGYDMADETKNFTMNELARPLSAPTQYPFNQNDVNNPAHREAAIYHWTPEISNFEDPHQEVNYQSAGLDDLNTQNPVVREALKDSYGFWIRETGVDAFRVDTAKYLEVDFYEDFIHSPNGVGAVARQTGREDFYTFGEINNTSLPFSDEAEQKIIQYLSFGNTQRMQAAIGYPLYKDIHRVFGGGEPTSFLSYRLRKQMELYDAPFLTANFIDNHDIKRFLSEGSVENYRQAMAFLMTVPGVPVIYQGNEQGIVEVRQAMFEGGYLSDKSHFDQQSAMYRFIQKLTGIRRDHRIFSRGDIDIIQDNISGSGVLAYERSYEGKRAYVVFNTARKKVLLNALQTRLDTAEPPTILATQNFDNGVQLSSAGTLTTVLPAQSFIIFMGNAAQRENKHTDETELAAVVIEQAKDKYIEQNSAEIAGSVQYPGAKLLRVIDGNLENAKSFSADENGHWKIDLPVGDLGEYRRFVEIYSPEHNVASRPHFYDSIYERADFEGSVEDPKGDDAGHDGSYVKPMNAVFGCNMDIESVSARATGAALEITIKMCEMGSVWASPSRYDRVSFSLFFDHPDRRGIRDLPLLNGRLPEGKQWDFAHVAYGWGSYMYSSKGATAERQGEKLGVSPPSRVKVEDGEVTFSYLGHHLGVTDWEDTTVYITTWDTDVDGVYRRAGDEPSDWAFSTGRPSDPIILDDASVTLRPVAIE